jgi:hypothetical protein
MCNLINVFLEECEMKKLVVMVLALSAMSFALNVTNANFDDDVLAEGAWGGAPTGWGGGNDKQNFDAGAGLVPEAQSGLNVDVINQGGWLVTSNVMTDDLGNAILVEANKTYQVSVWVGRRGDGCGTYAGIVKAWLSCASLETGAGIKISSALYDMEGNVAQGKWSYATFILTTGANPTGLGETLLLGFNNDGTRAGNFWEGQAILDSVTITEIPEPATMLLLGLGGVLLRKKK